MVDELQHHKSIRHVCILDQLDIDSLKMVLAQFPKLQPNSYQVFHDLFEGSTLVKIKNSIYEFRSGIVSAWIDDSYDNTRLSDLTNGFDQCTFSFRVELEHINSGIQQ